MYTDVQTLEACRWGYIAQVMTKLERKEGVKAFEGVFLSIRYTQ